MTAAPQPGREALPDGRGQRLRPTRGGAALSWRDVLDGWRDDDGFRAAFDGWIADAPYEAVFWETPPARRADLDAPFECVLLDAPALARMRPDGATFAHELSARGAAEVAVFDNLGGDARLVVPAPSDDPADHAHLAAFVRRAPPARRHALWAAVARALAARLGERPVWTSTSGLGVAWLHVRLDDVPKYYQHGPYRRPPA